MLKAFHSSILITRRLKASISKANLRENCFHSAKSVTIAAVIALISHKRRVSERRRFTLPKLLYLTSAGSKSHLLIKKWKTKFKVTERITRATTEGVFYESRNERFIKSERPTVNLISVDIETGMLPHALLTSIRHVGLRLEERKYKFWATRNILPNCCSAHGFN